MVTFISLIVVPLIIQIVTRIILNKLLKKHKAMGRDHIGDEDRKLATFLLTLNAISIVAIAVLIMKFVKGGF